MCERMLRIEIQKPSWENWFTKPIGI